MLRRLMIIMVVVGLVTLAASDLFALSYSKSINKTYKRSGFGVGLNANAKLNFNTSSGSGYGQGKMDAKIYLKWASFKAVEALGKVENGSDGAKITAYLKIVWNKVWNYNKAKGPISKSYYINKKFFSKTFQWMLGPVPVTANIHAGASFSAGFSVWTSSANMYASGSINGGAFGGIGIPVAKFGLKVDLKFFEGRLDNNMDYSRSSFKIKTKLSFYGLRVKLSFYAKIGWGWLSKSYTKEIVSYTAYSRSWTVLNKKYTKSSSSSSSSSYSYSYSPYSYWYGWGDYWGYCGWYW